MKFIVIGPFCWGQGASLKEAKRNAKREMSPYAKQSPKFFGYQVPDEAYVNGDTGGIVVPKGTEVVKLGEV